MNTKYIFLLLKDGNINPYREEYKFLKLGTDTMWCLEQTKLTMRKREGNQLDITQKVLMAKTFTV